MKSAVLPSLPARNDAVQCKKGLGMRRMSTQSVASLPLFAMHIAHLRFGAYT